jgi:hypothetical protein
MEEFLRLEGSRFAGQRDDVSWPGDLAVEDLDVFTLVDVLDLDQHIDLESARDGADKDTEPAANARSQRIIKDKQSSRADRTRARNRLAQARYRQKAKVRILLTLTHCDLHQ